ncbi:MAG: translation initiation factor IF-3 [Bacteroides sp.]|nr:MAG: translation initiation factor IF-3 [Bacteroides sp.]
MINNNLRNKKKYIHIKNRINEFITDNEVRLVGDNINPGIYKTRDALIIAKEHNLDLVEITKNVKPSIVKIIDYKKFLYEQKKKIFKLKNNKTVIKEIRFGPNTNDHDFEFKLKHAIKFIKNGAKVKPYVYFKGRSIVYKQQGENLLLKFIKSLNDIAKVEQMPKLEGKRMFVVITPIRK